MKELLNKKLLRKIKHEGISEIFQEGEIHSDAIYDYLSNRSYPNVRNMTNEQLHQYNEETSYLYERIHQLSPDFFNRYYFCFGGELYDISDEIEHRHYKAFNL